MSIPTYPDEIYVKRPKAGYGRGVSPAIFNLAAFELLWPDAVQKKPLYIKTDGEQINVRLSRRTILFRKGVEHVTLPKGVVPGDFFEFQNNTSRIIHITLIADDNTSSIVESHPREMNTARWNGFSWEYVRYDLYSLHEYVKESLDAISGWFDELGESIDEAVENLANDAAAIADAVAELNDVDTGLPKIIEDISSINVLLPGFLDKLSSSPDSGNAPGYREASARDLKTVLNVSTSDEVFATLRTRCNGVDTPDFSGLRIGDYIDLASLNDGSTNFVWNDAYKNLRLVIAGFNTYHNVGDTQNTKNHILLMFRNIILQRQVNTSNVNSGGMHGSALNTYLTGVFKNGLVAAMGGVDYVYPIRTARSKKGSTEWITQTVFLPSELEVFGYATYGDDAIAWNTNVQFPIFQDSNEYRIKYYNGARAWWWEATPPSGATTAFCNVDNDGRADCISASYTSGGVSPCFALS